MATQSVFQSLETWTIIKSTIHATDCGIYTQRCLFARPSCHMENFSFWLFGSAAAL